MIRPWPDPYRRDFYDYANLADAFTGMGRLADAMNS